MFKWIDFILNLRNILYFLLYMFIISVIWVCYDKCMYDVSVKRFCKLNYIFWGKWVYENIINNIIILIVYVVL